MQSDEIIRRLGAGEFVGRLAHYIGDVSDKVIRRNLQSATIHVKLEIRRNPDGTSVTIVESIKEDIPSMKPIGAVFWSIDGLLQDKDTRQTELFYPQGDIPYPPNKGHE